MSLVSYTINRWTSERVSGVHLIRRLYLASNIQHVTYDHKRFGDILFLPVRVNGSNSRNQPDLNDDKRINMINIEDQKWNHLVGQTTNLLTWSLSPVIEEEELTSSCSNSTWCWVVQVNSATEYMCTSMKRKAQKWRGRDCSHFVSWWVLRRRQNSSLAPPVSYGVWNRRSVKIWSQCNFYIP